MWGYVSPTVERCACGVVERGRSAVVRPAAAGVTAAVWETWIEKAEESGSEGAAEGRRAAIQPPSQPLWGCTHETAPPSRCTAAAVVGAAGRGDCDGAVRAPSCASRAASGAMTVSPAACEESPREGGGMSHWPPETHLLVVETFAERCTMRCGDSRQLWWWMNGCHRE